MEIDLRDSLWNSSISMKIIVCLSLSDSMHSHSFQDTVLELHRYVNDSTGQVVEELTILRFPKGLRNKGLITQKKKLIQHVFAQFSRYRVETSQAYVNNSP